MILAGAAAPPAHTETPSLNCARGTAAADKLVCATPALTALDSKLARDFANARAQGGVDGEKLQAQEVAWLSHVRDKCRSVACLKVAYEARDDQILTISRRSASPAAWTETRPFTVSPEEWAHARALVGRTCSSASDIPGYSKTPHVLPIVLPGGAIVVRERDAARFAFLTVFTPNGGCVIKDVVSLPRASQSSPPLQCAMPDMDLAGMGVRLTKPNHPVAFWTALDGRLMRQPVSVLGGIIRCSEPETGE